MEGLVYSRSEPTRDTSRRIGAQEIAPLSDSANLRISVFGIGYVGSVSAACLARDGHEVVAVDVNQDRVDIVNRGLSPSQGWRKYPFRRSRRAVEGNDGRCRSDLINGRLAHLRGNAVAGERLAGDVIR